MKTVLLLTTLLFGVATVAQEEPARRPQPNYTFTRGTAVCKDETYKCMYNCVVERDSICTPTRGSDSRCPNREVESYVTFGGRTMVIKFKGYHDMGCSVRSFPRTNMHCGVGKYGWGCHAGPMHQRHF